MVVCADLVVRLLEVLGELDFLSVVDESVVDGSPLEVDVIHPVGALVPPVSNDGLPRKLLPHNLLGSMLRALARIHHLLDLLQTSCRRHELENVVHCQCAAHLTLESRGLETRPHAQANVGDICGSVDIKEAGGATKLLEVGLAEGLLQDDVNQVLADLVRLVLEVVGQVDLASRVLVDLDHGLVPLEDCLEDQRIFELAQSVDGLAGDDICAKCLLKRGLLGANDVMDAVSLPHLVRCDVKHVLVHTGVLTQSKSVLVRHQIDRLTTSNDHGLRLSPALALWFSRSALISSRRFFGEGRLLGSLLLLVTVLRLVKGLLLLLLRRCLLRHVHGGSSSGLLRLVAKPLSWLHLCHLGKRIGACCKVLLLLRGSYLLQRSSLLLLRVERHSLHALEKHLIIVLLVSLGCGLLGLAGLRTLLVVASIAVITLVSIALLLRIVLLTISVLPLLVLTRIVF